MTLRATGRISTTGWYLSGGGGDILSLSGATLEALEEMRVDSSDFWRDDGDTAFLFDPAGRLVDSLSYAGGGSEVCR